MIRRIDGFRQDEEGEWVAELSCLHNQHLRHRPPFQEREWVTTAEGRAARIGAPLECPLCDRAELPDGLAHARTAGPWDDKTVPAAVQRDHRVAEKTWGVLRVLEGAVHFTMATDPPVQRVLRAGDEQPIPPGVAHSAQPEDSVRMALDFYVRVNDT